jgi:exodeoxyribonuclease III
MFIFSWNTDSLQDDKWTKLKSFIITNDPDIICINETKSKQEHLISLFSEIPTYDYIINSHVPAFMHGVAILIKKSIPWKPLSIAMDCTKRSDTKSSDASSGRIIAILIETDQPFVVITTYVPNSGVDQKNPLKNLSYRTDMWDPALRKVLISLQKKYQHVIWIGDINVAPENIDVSHPTLLSRKAGFTIEERTSHNTFMSHGWIDIWRHLNPSKIAYSFKGYSGHKINLRLDHCIITPSLLDSVEDCIIYPDHDFLESDHNPISIKLKSKQPKKLLTLTFKSK